MAYSDCKAAIALDPLYVKGHLRAGMALGLLERPQEGLDHYIAAIEIEPHNEQVTHSPSPFEAGRGRHRFPARTAAMK